MAHKKQNICESKTFETIYKLYAKDLRRFLFFKTQNIEKAEDLLQDAFVQLWNNCENVDYNKVKSYLFSVGNNMFLNLVKHSKVVRNYKNQVSKKVSQESPEYIYLEKEFLEKLEKAISNLPEKQREVFLMNRIEKKKYKEIASQLDISLKAVEKRMHSALVYMREHIGDV